jgi:RNA polymerase primary sigma factor
LSQKSEALLADEAPIAEMEELRPLIAEGHDKGVLSIEQIASALEEVDVTKEQVGELHAYLEEQGIDIVAADGKPVTNEGAKLEAAAEKKVGGEALTSKFGLDCFALVDKPESLQM